MHFVVLPVAVVHATILIIEFALPMPHITEFLAFVTAAHLKILYHVLYFILLLLLLLFVFKFFEAFSLHGKLLLLQFFICYLFKWLGFAHID